MAKIAVYAICKNEQKHAARFMASMCEADGVYVLDTGSQDQSPRILRDLGAVVEEVVIDPWRFDTARNMALAMVPLDYDICVCCDLDEVFVSGWRQTLENAWQADTTRLAYPFYYDNQGSFFYRSLIHSRRGYVWRWPIHETLAALGPERVVTCDALQLFHLPDPEKSRAAYLPMLEQAVRDHPMDVRMLRYLGREYFYRSRYTEALAVLDRHAALEPWDAQQAASLREMARCHLALGDYTKAEEALQHSIKACPGMREGYVELACLCLYNGRPKEALTYARAALAITTPHPTYFNEGFAWGPLPEEIVRQAAQSLGLTLNE